MSSSSHLHDAAKAPSLGYSLPVRCVPLRATIKIRDQFKVKNREHLEATQDDITSYLSRDAAKPKTYSSRMFDMSNRKNGLIRAQRRALYDTNRFRGASS